MRKYTFIIALFCGISVLFAQNEKELQKAKEMYKNFAYVDAIKIYESIAKKGFVNQDILEKHYLGTNSYLRIRNIKSNLNITIAMHKY